MMQNIVAVAFIAAVAASCSRSAGDAAPAVAVNATPPVRTPDSGKPTTEIETFFDPATVQALIIARAQYDADEAAIVAESEKIIGKYRNVMMASREQITRQLAGNETPVPRSEGWRYEQQRRVAYAASVTQPKLDAARASLRTATLEALAEFFANERRTGRIADSDYQRYTVEIRQGYLPPFRARKWTGPAVYEWRSGDLSPEYQKILQEVRRLWQAQSRPNSAIVSHRTAPSFYKTLVAATQRRR